jgi:hypothetical protein
MCPVQNDDGEDGISPVAMVMSGMPEVWQRLIEEHVPDRYGRCTACRNACTAGVPWPCTLRVIADDARGLHLGRRELSDPAPRHLVS